HIFSPPFEICRVKKKNKWKHHRWTVEKGDFLTPHHLAGTVLAAVPMTEAAGLPTGAEAGVVAVPPATTSGSPTTTMPVTALPDDGTDSDLSVSPSETPDS